MDSEDGEESEEEDRDKDVDPGFRQQLMEVLKAGNALVSRTQGRGVVQSFKGRLMALLLCLRVEWTMRRRRRRSLGMRP